MMIAALSSFGLHALHCFAGEFLALIGVFRAHAIYGVLGTAVIVPAAWDMIRFVLGIMEGPLQKEVPVGALLRKGTLSDINIGEFMTLLPLLALIFYIGFQ